MEGSHNKRNDPRVSCAVCAEPVGVYEPAVFVEGATITRTSRAATPRVEEIADCTAFHGACYDARDQVRG